MLNEYKPFENCAKAASPGEEKSFVDGYNNTGARWFLAAVELVIELAYTYDAIANSGNNTDDLLAKIDDQLDVLRVKLDNLLTKIDTLIAFLNKLPLIIRGEVENSLIKQTLGEADQIVLLLQDKLRPQFVESNLNSVALLCEQLQIKMGGILGLKGLSGVVIVSPYQAAWLSAAVAVEKIRKKINPSYAIDSPWDRGFMKKNGMMFKDLIIQCEKQDIEYNGVINKMPPHQQTLEVTSDGWLIGSLSGFYRLTCPFGLTGERLQYQLPGIPAKWKDVKSSDVAHASAYNAWTRIREKREEMVHFYDVIPKLYAERTSILNTFTEPKGFFDKPANIEMTR